MNTIAAIPTRYNGVQFRSRLEARWAAFFDLLGWRWDYEPIDLDGYIPDFIVSDSDHQVLVEVKPIVQWPCPVDGCRTCGARDVDRSTHDDAIEVIRKSGWRGEALLVGAVFPEVTPHKTMPGSLFDQRPIGRGGLGYTLDEVHALDSDDFYKWHAGRAIGRCRRCPRIYLTWCLDDDSGASFNNLRWCDCCDSEKARAGESNLDPTPLWREAGNRVQWRGVAATPEPTR